MHNTHPIRNDRGMGFSAQRSTKPHASYFAFLSDSQRSRPPQNVRVASETHLVAISSDENMGCSVLILPRIKRVDFVER